LEPAIQTGYLNRRFGGSGSHSGVSIRNSSLGSTTLPLLRCGAGKEVQRGFANRRTGWKAIPIQCEEVQRTANRTAAPLGTKNRRFKRFFDPRRFGGSATNRLTTRTAMIRVLYTPGIIPKKFME